MPLGFIALTAVISPLLLATPIPHVAHVQGDMEINEHVSYEAEPTPQGGLHVRFRFKDHTETPQVFDYTYDYQHTLEMIARFGLPSGMLRPYRDSERENRQKLLDNGMFKLKGDTLAVDLSAVSTFYSDEFAKPIADFILASLRQRGMDTRKDRISMAMAFTEDIPYGVPDFDDDGVFRGGLSPAPLILLSGFGDCDSKVTLFVGILRHLIRSEDILFLHEVGESHLLAAVRDDSATGGTTLKVDGKTFVITDIAGPGRLEFGEMSAGKKGMTVTHEAYENRMPVFHADADYSVYGPVGFHGLAGKVAFRGSGSQEPDVGSAQQVASREVPAASEPPEPSEPPEEREGLGAAAESSDEGEAQEEPAASEAYGSFQPPEPVAPDDGVVADALEIRSVGDAVEIRSTGTGNTVWVKCGDVVTIHTRGGAPQRIHTSCRGAPTSRGR